MHQPVPPTRSQSTGANTGFPTKDKKIKRISSLFGFGQRNSSKYSRPPQIVTPPQVSGLDGQENEDSAVSIAIYNSLLDQIEGKELNDALCASRVIPTTSISKGPEHLDEATRLAIIASLEENPDLMTSSRSETYDYRLPDIHEEDLRIRSPLPQHQSPEECGDTPIRLVYPPTPELEAGVHSDGLDSGDDDVDIYGEQLDPTLFRKTYLTRSREGLNETNEAECQRQELYPPGVPRF